MRVHITDYFSYEAALWDVVVHPLLQRGGVTVEGGFVLDVGCGHGGVLAGLLAAYPNAVGLGIDSDPGMIATARSRGVARAEFVCADFLEAALPPADLVLFRDVLEHVPRVEQAFERVVSLVRPGGFLLLSYAPFFSPFGGHQHNGVGITSYIPWLHVLPERLFRRLLRVGGNAYKSKPSLEADIESVLATRLTMRRVRALLQRSDLTLILHERYIIRPDYRLKFGVPSLRLPRRAGSVWSEALCTAEEMVLRKGGTLERVRVSARAN